MTSCLCILGSEPKSTGATVETRKPCEDRAKCRGPYGGNVKSEFDKA